jgi:hypothetical protein
MMVAQVGLSPAAFWLSISTFSAPKPSVTASMKALGAASRATWGASWQMPIL